jgi:hypothetical protein
MAGQEPYEIGRIVKELAEARRIQLTIGTIDHTNGMDFLDYLNHPFSQPGVSDWLVFRMAREGEVAFEGKNNTHHFIYGGSKENLVTSEGVYISTPEREIMIVRGIKYHPAVPHPNYIEVKDRKAWVLQQFRTMAGSPDHPCDGRFIGSVGFIGEDIPKLKKALEALL